MNKERLAAFFDAVLAIIMTILILELEKPQELNWQGLVALAPNFFAYTLSFLWLGAMWMGIHNTWERVTQISSRTVTVMMCLLFFASFFPYTTSIVAQNFNNSFAQIIYGIIAMLVSICVVISYQTLRLADPKNKALKEEIADYMPIFYFDLGIKLLGMVLSATIYPPAMMYSILIAGFAVILPRRLYLSHKHDIG
ncbi:TMEM175 family protein [Latilactobacillus fuchuensis]|uniref:TMEM175 family protein n=1 Tax=Latilactobacillus fuchuensis TaxID=164393 RepID=UPI0020C79036|nr:TMEM175 family protein [Latilactobacillus fuchuensis]MCP8857908.1 TMEM175 family protein [Latilactobacillus fuchuensis]